MARTPSHCDRSRHRRTPDRRHRGLGLALAAVLGTAATANAHDVPLPSDADVVGAVYRATVLNRFFPECASTFGNRSARREAACQKGQNEYRDGFRVAVEACNEGGQVPGLNVTIPTSYTCTIAIQEAPEEPVSGGAVILYEAAGIWNAILL